MVAAQLQDAVACVQQLHECFRALFPGTRTCGSREPGAVTLSPLPSEEVDSVGDGDEDEEVVSSREGNNIRELCRVLPL